MIKDILNIVYYPSIGKKRSSDRESKVQIKRKMLKLERFNKGMKNSVYKWFNLGCVSKWWQIKCVCDQFGKG